VYMYFSVSWILWVLFVEITSHTRWGPEPILRNEVPWGPYKFMAENTWITEVVSPL